MSDFIWSCFAVYGMLAAVVTVTLIILGVRDRRPTQNPAAYQNCDYRKGGPYGDSGEA